MHTLSTLVREYYPNILIFSLYDIHDLETIQEHVNRWKKKNCRVFIESDDNHLHRKFMQTIRSQYDKFLFTAPGRNDDEKHVTNFNYITSIFTKNTVGPRIDHNTKKIYRFLCLVGKTHEHRWDLMNSLRHKGLLNNNFLFSLHNTLRANTHLWPNDVSLPEQYEWPEINEHGGYRPYADVSDPGRLAWLSRQGHIHHRLYQDTAVSVVSEASVEKGLNLITEKTWAPILAEQPAIFQANSGHIDFLEQVGFKIRNEVLRDYVETDCKSIASLCHQLDDQTVKELYMVTKNHRFHNRQLALDEAHWREYHLAQLKSFAW